MLPARNMREQFEIKKQHEFTNDLHAKFARECDDASTGYERSNIS
jgi:hypothetical protein